MTRSRLGLFGLCAVLFGLMAFGATGAQATAGAKWLILDKAGALKEGSTLHASLGLEKDSSELTLHSEILHIKVLFLCTEVKAVSAFLQKEGTIAKEYNAEGKPVGSQVLFSGCTTDLNGSPAPECTPKDPTDGEGFIVTNTGHALIILGGSGQELVKVLPDIGETFATIVLPASCPIGTKVPVIGKLTLKDCGERVSEVETCVNKFKTHQIKHLTQEGPESELWTISKTAEHVATLKGSAWAFLTGEHVGLKWSGDPA